MSTQDIIEKQLADNAVILYMKGVPTAPECGFSAKAVGILNAINIPFAYVDVLKAPFIREKLPKISKWATFPQLFINGELVGGCDIVESMYNDGSLLPMLQATIKTNSETVTHSEVSMLISKGYPKAKISIEGQGCDLTISVESEDFAGLPLVKQHQGVMATLNDVLASGRLHAITLKTSIPEEAQPVVQLGLLQIQS